MAALFKIARHDKPMERKIIKAATIDELISSAKVKLQLTQEKYKIYTADFTDIDEDEILMELAKAKATKGEQLLLTMVPDGIPWNSNPLHQENNPSSSTGVPHGTISVKASTSHQGTPKKLLSSLSSSSHQADDLSKIFPKFPTNIQSNLSDGKTLDPRDRRSMVRTIRDYMINDLKNTSHGATHNISTQIVNAFKKTFIGKIGGGCTKGQIEALRESIYTACNYQKQSDKSSNLSCIQDYSLDEADEEGSTLKTKVQDEYGCVAYLPVSPPAEVLVSLKEKQLKLEECYNFPDEEISNEILTLMDDCYYLQRKEIHKEKNLSVIFEHWPYFHNYKLIIQHANQLLGKKTDSKWKEILTKLAKPINRWARNEEIVREVKGKHKKSMAGTEKRYFYVRESMKMAKKYSNNMKNDEPYHVILFGFITKFMEEDSSYLYVLINEEVTDEELLQHVPVVNPVLIIRGQDLHHTDNVYNVVIEKEILLHCRSFIEGMLVTFLSYYVFGISYPREIEGTLETIQRLFLEICPPKGTKRGGKRKATTIHPKVNKLSRALEPYIEDTESD